MKLLQTEIDIEPGRPALQSVKEGQIGAGCAILRLVNETARENAYTVRLKCDNPYWREEWYRITSIPGPIPAAGAAINARADAHGPQDRWIKTFVPTGGRRDVQISFYAPQTPSSRAGKYRVSVVVETQITNPAAGAGRDARISELQAIVIVRPYYKWSVDLSPEGGRRVGFFRRKASLEIVVTNEGNDWLYCDIRTQGQKDVLLETPAQLVAVPPPAPEKDARSTRSVPLDARTRLRTKRGDPIPQLLPLTPTRIDAPSIAPLPDNRRFDLMSSTGSGAAVIAAPTTDVQPTPGDRTLKYHPIIPGTVAGATGWVVQNIKGLVAFALMLVVLIPLANFLILATIRQISIQPLNLDTMDGQVGIRGSYIARGKIFYKVGDNGVEVKDPLPIELGAVKPHDNVANNILQNAANDTHLDVGHVTIPPNLKGSTIIFTRAQHDFFIQPLSALLSQPVTGRITYGTPADAGKRTVSVVVSIQHKPGTDFMIIKTGKPWPQHGVAVIVGKYFAQSRLDANGNLWATVPKGIYDGDDQQVKVTPGDGDPDLHTEVILDLSQTGATAVPGTGQPSGQAGQTAQTKSGATAVPGTGQPSGHPGSTGPGSSGRPGNVVHGPQTQPQPSQALVDRMRKDFIALIGAAYNPPPPNPAEVKSTADACITSAQEVIQQAPDYARGYAVRAYALLLKCAFLPKDPRTREQAIADLDKANEADSTDAFAILATQYRLSIDASIGLDRDAAMNIVNKLEPLTASTDSLIAGLSLEITWSMKGVSGLSKAGEYTRAGTYLKNAGVHFDLDLR